MSSRAAKRCVIGVALGVSAAGCSGSEGSPDSGPEALQSQCVIDQLDLERNIADGKAFDNWGYSDCNGFGSECIGYCAHKFCQPEACESSCPSACIQGSVCCGGSLCSGNCIGTPCCS